MTCFLVLIVFAMFTSHVVTANNNTYNQKVSKSIFNVIQFPNTACAGSGGRNGTCYTGSECSSKGGTNSGTCANGYGVCCIITLGCGKTSSENCTYLVLGSTSTPGTACEYNICKCNPNICRLRFDFNIFNINPPFVGTLQTVKSTAITNGGSIGDCIEDSFVVTSPGNRGSPVICGFNTGQHMYIDASDKCSQVLFGFGAPGFMRTYDIKVTQYNCEDEKAGPNDCLQYFTSDTGTVSSYNFQLMGSLVTSQVTHLSSQCYQICFRRNAGFCALCFQPTILAGAGTVNNQASFGLSAAGDKTAAAAPMSLTETWCYTDYLVIPNGQAVSTTAVIGFTNGPSRFCGRFFNVISMTGASNSVCTGRRPFRIIFKTDADEANYASILAIMYFANTDETVGVPGGSIGFSLMYWQAPCMP